MGTFLFINEYDTLLSSTLYNYEQKIVFEKHDTIKNLQFKTSFYDFGSVFGKLKTHSVAVSNNVITIDEDTYHLFKNDKYFSDVIIGCNHVNITPHSHRRVSWGTYFKSTPTIPNSNNFFKVYYQDGVS